MAKLTRQPYPVLFQLQHLVSDLSKIDRNHYSLGTNSREDDIEHSFTVAIQCWFIVSQNHLPLDLSLVLQYAIAHDFVERYAGDTNTFASKQQRAEKVERERKSLERFKKEFAEFPSMLSTMHNYEVKSDSESLFVWTVDKMQALILGDQDNWRPYNELSISYEAFCNKYAELLEQASPYCKEIFETLIEYCQSTYYDRPETSQHR